MPNFKTLFIILLFCQVSDFVFVPSKLKIPSAFFPKLTFSHQKLLVKRFSQQVDFPILVSHEKLLVNG